MCSPVSLSSGASVTTERHLCRVAFRRLPYPRSRTVLSSSRAHDLRMTPQVTRKTPNLCSQYGRTLGSHQVVVPDPGKMCYTLRMIDIGCRPWIYFYLPTVVGIFLAHVFVRIHLRYGEWVYAFSGSLLPPI